MDQVGHTLTKIKEILLHLGFEETIITNAYRSEINYMYKNLYCIPGYVEGLGFIIEYANSFEEAQKHFHEDGDSFPLEMGEKSILVGIEKEVLEYVASFFPID